LSEKEGSTSTGRGTSSATKGGTKETLCQEADRLIHSVKAEEYGHPKDNFRRLAVLWTEYLKQKYPSVQVVVDEDDVINMFILHKVARSMQVPTRDTYVDVAGYAGCWARIHEGE